MNISVKENYKAPSMCIVKFSDEYLVTASGMPPINEDDGPIVLPFVPVN